MENITQTGNFIQTEIKKSHAYIDSPIWTQTTRHTCLSNTDARVDNESSTGKRKKF